MATFNGRDWTVADMLPFKYVENWDDFFDDVIAEMNARRSDLGASLVATSATSDVAIGTGTKTLTVANPFTKGFSAGMYVVAVDAANSASAMTGRVTSYNTTTGALVISVPPGGTTGGGTPSSWTVGISGAVGPTGVGVVAADPNTIVQRDGAGAITTAGLNSPDGATGILTNTVGMAEQRSRAGWNFPQLALRRQEANASTVKMLSLMLGADNVADTTMGAYWALWLMCSGAPTSISTSSIVTKVVWAGPGDLELRPSGKVAFGAAATAKQATLAYASTIALDFAAQDYIIGDLTGPLTLANPSAYPVGQRGEILVHEDGTGGRTVSFAGAWIKVGKDAVNPAAGKYSVITYWVAATGVVIYSIAGGA